MEPSTIEAVTSYGLAGLMVVSAVAMFLIGRKMGRGEIPPNDWVGVRTSRACRSEEDWYAVQSASAPSMFLLAIVLLDCAVLFAVQGFLHEHVSILVPGVAAVVQLAVGIVLALRAASGKNSGPR